MGVQLQTREHCPICTNRKTRTLHQQSFSSPILRQFLADFYQGRADLEALASGSYRIAKCQTCSFIYQTSVLNDEGLSALYGDWVDAEASLAKKQNARAKLFRQYAGQMETLSRLFPCPPQQVHLLEFGMGWGYWSRMAQAFGFRVNGLELSPQRAEHARSMGIAVVDELPDAGPHYHFIYANQVFEHLVKPLQTLQQLQSILIPDGLIYLRVPDGRDIEKTLQRSGWHSNLDAIHPLEHINCFTRTSLLELASRAGLEQVQPPLRLNLRSLWGGIKREYSDRFVTTHIYFKNK
ncbi:MAG: class I SAM-dependent methyltransferase [Gammaproteobacteria bacterium]|nr:class I SAM-dependent methyltransferase [Gammaproteobacteria bacterium]MCZ6667733.1 class I SAM-dependent methyltransferase [Gammaproteobacteria bacterium]MCZ6798349.1 class I SAM-dependent methyltransferase [Gammaproteobacteria bacterium]